MPRTPRELMLLERADQALAEATTIDEIKALRDKAEAARSYARSAKLGLAIQNQAAEIKIKAERKAGKLIGDLNLHGGKRSASSHDENLKLSDLDIDHNQSHRWQMAASVPEKAFRDYVTSNKGSQREITTSGLLRIAKQIRAETELSPANNPTTQAGRFVQSLKELRGEKFSCIMADPPWQYENDSTRAAAKNHYPTLSVRAITRLPIRELTSKNAHLHLWTTSSFLKDAFSILDTWGFAYRSSFVWVKPQLGIGNYWRMSHEILLLGVRGTLPFRDKSLRRLFRQFNGWGVFLGGVLREDGGMKSLTEHYRLLLGLDSAWNVGSVSLSLEDKKVEIELEHLGGRVACPDCGHQCPIADHAPSRTWRHLDTMQFETILRAQVPRVHCPEHGVKTATVPWADKHSRFTWFFEAFVVQILQATSNLSAASRLLRLDWDALQRVMERAVERGMERREEREMPYLGVDEKNFGKGQDYVSILTDIAGSRILEVVEDRTQAAAESLFETLSEEQRDKVEAVAMDMSQAYRNAVEKCAPQAAIVHDKFHLAKHLNEAVDQVRRQEHKVLRAEGDERLTGSRQLWLFRPENIEPDLRLVFDDLRAEELKTSRAWALKEQFRWFWEYTYAGNAKKFFDRWYAWASRCRLKPIVKVAAMFKRHLPRLLTYFKHPITNATSEGFNSRVQAIKAQARGFRDFANYRVRILFHCGRLDLEPSPLTH